MFEIDLPDQMTQAEKVQAIKDFRATIRNQKRRVAKTIYYTFNPGFYELTESEKKRFSPLWAYYDEEEKTLQVQCEEITKEANF